MIIFFTAKYLPLLGVAAALLLVWTMLALQRREAAGFEEREPYEIGFAKIHAEQIQPQLNTLESQRRLAISASLLVWGTGAVIAAEIVQNLGLDPKTKSSTIFDATWKVIAGTAFLSIIPIGTFWKREEGLMLSAICAHFSGLNFRLKVKAAPADLSAFHALNLLPPRPAGSAKSNAEPKEVVEYEEMLTGVYKGFELWLAEGTLTMVRGEEEDQFFRGTLIAITLPERSDRRYFLKPLPAPPPRLAHLNKVEGEAERRRVCLDTLPVRTALTNLSKRMRSTSRLCGCEGAKFYIAMEQQFRARPLSVGGPWRSAYKLEPAIRSALRQITAVYGVIDALAMAIEEDVEWEETL